MGRSGLPSRWLPAAVVAAAWATYLPVTMQYLAYGTAGGLAVWLLVAEGRTREVLRQPVFQTGLALWAWLALGAAWSSAPTHTWISHAWTYSLMLWVPWVAAATRPDAARRALQHFVAASCLAALAFLVDDLGLTAGWSWQPLGGVSGNRRIAYSVLVALAGSLAVHLAWESKKRRRAVWLMAACLCLLGLLHQDRRTGLLALPLLLLLVVHAHQRGWRQQAALAAAVVGVAVLAWVGSPAVQQRFAEGLSELASYRPDGDVQTSWGMRLRMWQVTIHQVLQHPLLGHGLGSWATEWRRSVDGSAVLVDHTTPHNEYLLIVFQGGGVAGLLLLALVARCLVGVARRGAGGTPALLVLATIALTGTFHGVLRDVRFALPLLTLAAVAWAAARVTAAPSIGSGASPHVYRRSVDPHRRSSLSVIAALVPDGSKVLDLGVGTGSLGQLLADRSCAVDGLTLSPDERDAAGPAYRRVEVQSLEDPEWIARWPAAHYDVVVCADVLEHLRDPERTLRACIHLLRPGGRLLASIPNAAYAGMVVDLMHGNWRYGPEGLLDRTHLRFFTRRSFSHLLAECGWRTERVEPIDSTWYDTEFWTPFDRLPPAVATYLLAQPDASTYQLVFEARPAGQPAAVAAGAAAPVPPANPSTHVAVFASLAVAPGPDGRECKVAALGRVGLPRQTLRYVLPAEARLNEQLRWYPADRAGYLHLHSLVVRDAQGHERWHWSAMGHGAAALKALLGAQVQMADAVMGIGALPLLLQGEAPQLVWAPSTWPDGPGPGPWTLEVECGWPLSADYLALNQALLGPAVAADRVVEVIVPVYGNLTGVQRCLASVLRSGGQTPWHLTVIDDASPSVELERWLVDFAREHPQATVIRNARNLGFVGTVNLGMCVAGRRDVVLLNSDTEVPPGWLDRLHAAAYSGSRVGSATPFSNNATICSYPRFCEPNDLPDGHDTASLDALFARELAGRVVQVPTAVGFCMYIRRDCLDATGLFDVETFGAGYGEENDFCLRASTRGWVHVHALDVFVFHEGGASFNDRQLELQATALAAMRRLHPGYEDLVRAYVQADPARSAREVIDQALGP